MTKQSHKIIHHSYDVLRRGFFLQNNLDEFRNQYISNLVMMPIYRLWSVFQDGGRTRSTHSRNSDVLCENFQPVSVLNEVKNVLSKESKIFVQLFLKIDQVLKSEPPYWHDVLQNRRQIIVSSVGTTLMKIKLKSAKFRFQNHHCYGFLCLNLIN